MKPQDTLPPELEERAYSSYKEHVEAAHALLHCTLAFWEAEDLDGLVRGCKALVTQHCAQRLTRHCVDGVSTY